jgi:putative DNA methylase
MTNRKKLIEVALPLVAINAASAREKSIRHGHPSTLHLWWARRPLAACRAVLFASLVDDPSEHPEEFPTEQAQEKERERLFRLIEELVKWENSNNENVLRQARAEILKSTGGNPPPVFDPFAGGGSIPLEAQRLGLEAHASDLNPVAVLINKALIEIPPKFAGRPPVNPEARQSLMGADWSGARGLADDIRYYGKWMRDEAEQRIGHLYPKVTLPKEYGGGEATVIAWLWARTVTCPNPACGIETPLLTSFVLSSKKGKETFIVPQVSEGQVYFSISSTPPKSFQDSKKGLKRGISGVFECVSCQTVTTRDYVSQEAKAKRLGLMQTAVVVQGKNGRAYLPPNFAPLLGTIPKVDTTGLDANFSPNPRDVWCRNFGLDTPADLFTPRQLVALTTFSDLVQEAREKVLADASVAGLLADGVALNDGGTGADAYADAVVTYLGIGLSKLADASTSLTHWKPTMDQAIATFARQALPMVWDYAESNVFNGAAGDYTTTINNVARVLSNLDLSSCISGNVWQSDATTNINTTITTLVSTDPPYYDNIGYADLSDFFYVWLRRSLNRIFPDLFKTMLVPKAQELVATPYRFNGDKRKAQEFFESGLAMAFAHMRAIQHPDYPLTVYYAFKQAESEAERDEEDQADDNRNRTQVIASTGWETMLEGLIRAGFAITGTWPMRTEMANRTVGQGTNVLASSIVLVCRPRPVDAPIASRRQFLNALRAELPAALKNLQHGSIAPVDLAQASIGPGMAIYSRYSKVVESDGTPLRVRTALQLINRALDEALAEQEGEYDAETRWAVAWFEQYAMNAAEYGIAETLSKAKNTSVQTLVDAGLLEARAGKVRLLKREELATKWDPKASRLTVWEVMQRMIHELLDGKGDSGAGDILRKASAHAEVARDLAYRLYTVCERKGWAQEALAYNSLVTSWSEISRLAHREAADGSLWGATFLG